MNITACSGHELVKAQSNTSEDFFNRSEVTYTLHGQEHTLHVLYVRYFEEQLPQFTPFTGDPIMQVEQREVTFKEIAALACLLQDPGLAGRKRLYINTIEDFSHYFSENTAEQIKKVLGQLYKSGKAEVHAADRTA